MSSPLRLAATVELVSLVVLLVNLATVHVPALASLLGPVHGSAYLAAIALTVSRAGWRSRATALCLVPGVGGLLADTTMRRVLRGRRVPTPIDPPLRRAAPSPEPRDCPFGRLRGYDAGHGPRSPGDGDALVEGRRHDARH